MKIIIILAASFMPLCLKAQFSKKENIITAKDSLQSVVDLKLTLSSDTSKARIVLFSKGDSDQFLSWVEGYVITKSYKMPNGNVLSSVGNIAYNKTWQIINPDIIYDVKLINPPSGKR